MTSELEALFSSIYGDSAPESRTVFEGRLSSVSVSQNRIGVRLEETKNSFTVAANAIVTLAEKPVTLGELIKGYFAKVVANGKVAKEVHALSSCRAVVREVDERDLAVQVGMRQERFRVADGLTVVLDDEPSTIDGLKTGMIVRITIGDSRGITVVAATVESSTQET